MSFNNDKRRDSVLVNVPQDVLEVASHFSWLNELTPYMDCSNRKGEGQYSLADHLRDRDMGHTIFDAEPNENTREQITRRYNSEAPAYCVFYADILNRAVRLAYLGLFNEALARLQLVDIEEINNAIESSRKLALDYAVDALKWTINTWSRHQAGNEDHENIEDPQLLQLRWAELQTNNKCLAVFQYLKGKLGCFLYVVEDKILEIYKDAVSLDPEYHIWHLAVYRALRSRRRCIWKPTSCKLKPPSDEEIDACEKAYELAPGIFLNLKHTANMLKDILETKFQRPVNGKWPLDIYLRCKTLFQKALEIADRRKESECKRKVSMHLAELLLDHRNPYQHHAYEGKQLLKDCMEQNPGDSQVLYKLAKIYNQNRHYKKDQDQALDFYRQAVEADPANYPCVKDYLKVLALRGRFKEFVQVCEQSAGEIKDCNRIGTLLTWQGCVIWESNPLESKENEQDACELWLRVISDFTGSVEALYVKTITSPLFFCGKRRNEYVSLDCGKIIATLDGIRSRCESEDHPKINLISKFIQGLTGEIEERNRNVTAPKPTV